MSAEEENQWPIYRSVTAGAHFTAAGSSGSADDLTPRLLLRLTQMYLNIYYELLEK